MKRIVKGIATAGTICCFVIAGFSLPASAESIEREWKYRNNAQTTTSTGFFSSFLPAKSTTAKQPAPAAIKTTKQLGPKAKIKRVKAKKPVKRKAKTKTKVIVKAPGITAKKKAQSKQAAWWKNIGNPAVFAFRDCSARFASVQTAHGVRATPAQFITRAMKASCQVHFAKMAGVLIGGLGEEKSNAMLGELAKTTFLPTVKAAIDVETNKRTVAAQKSDRKTSSRQALQTAKAAMFHCFSQKTDLLSAAKSTGANTIADSVIIGCQNKSDAFFDLLLANSKATAQVKQEQKYIALNETYRVAIIRRVLASRKPTQIKTATGIEAQ